MTMPLSLRCRCGTVRGTLTGIGAADRKRVVCYCDDCQIYARHLAGDGLLDERGGTEVVISAPAQVTLTAGASELRCMRLGP